VIFCFLAVLSVVVVCFWFKQENPEITKLWEQHKALVAETRELTFREDRERKSAIGVSMTEILDEIVEIDPDARFSTETISYYARNDRSDDIKVADVLKEIRQRESIRESEQKIKRLQDASDNFDRDMGN
jgi:hypothetical protein